MASDKAPAGPKSRPDGSRSPYQDNALENKPHSYPKGQGDFKGRGGYPDSKHNTTNGGYKR